MGTVAPADRRQLVDRGGGDDDGPPFGFGSGLPIGSYGVDELRRFSPFMILAFLAFPAFAHDMWLQPQSFWLPGPGIATVATFVGHGPDRARWGVAADRIVRLQSIGPDGRVVDQRRTLGRALDRDVPIALGQTGTHVVVLESSHAESNLPALRFNSYIRDEGLSLAIADRDQNGTTQRPGREIYSRRAKTMLQVGPLARPQPQVTRAAGLTLEIVPELNPYGLRPGQALPVRVYYQGRPLPGALVMLTDLREDAKPVERQRTDAAGRAVFKGRESGLWQMNVIWSRPLAGNPRADYDTTFSSLTWGFPAP